MIIRFPSYKRLFWVFFLTNILFVFLFILFGKIRNLQFSFTWDLLFGFNFATVFPFLLFGYCRVNKVIIDCHKKTVTIIIYIFHFFKIKEYKFNDYEAVLSIRHILYGGGYGDGEGIWRLYLCRGDDEFLIMESWFKKILVRKCNEIKFISGCQVSL